MMNIYHLEWTDTERNQDEGTPRKEFYCWKKDLWARIKVLKKKYADDDQFEYRFYVSLLDKPITRDAMAAWLNRWFGTETELGEP